MKFTVGIIGTGAMGAGIAQVAASNGCKVLLHDTNLKMLDNALAGINASLSKLVEKGILDKNSLIKSIKIK